MMNKITIYTEKIYFKDKEITDPNEISTIIKNQISHLGEFSIYYRCKPKGWIQKLLYMIAGNYY